MVNSWFYYSLLQVTVHRSLQIPVGIGLADLGQNFKLSANAINRPPSLSYAGEFGSFSAGPNECRGW